MIFFGSRASNIGDFEVSNTDCKYCQEGNTQHISVFGRYAHIFWIPIIPLGKKAVAECTNCKRTIDQKEFSPALQSLYEENKDKAKRPFWHWIGPAWLACVAVLFIFALIIIEDDPRSDLFEADEAQMVTNPTMESDSISYIMKQLFDNFSAEDFDPSEFKYFTKVQDNKALILIQIPKLSLVEMGERRATIEMVEQVARTQPTLQDKELYIGLKGVVSMSVIKTPTYSVNKNVTSDEKLYDFYGPIPTNEE